MKYRLILILLLSAFTQAFSQALYFNSAVVEEEGASGMSAADDEIFTPVYASLADSIIAEGYAPDTIMGTLPLPRYFFMPAVFAGYHIPDTTSVFAPELSGRQAFRWIEEANAQATNCQRILQGTALNHPESIYYNIEWLPEPIHRYEAVINIEDNTVTINEIPINLPQQSTVVAEEIRKRHWIRNFNSSLQFSQAYVSPNWYQGGNSNLNALLNIYYNVKLNPAFHPRLLFETTFQYKLGINSTPDDSLRNYNVSEDMLQINTLLGVKAAKKWYYSLTVLFKTQIVNSYTSNTNNLRAALLSPAELNLGLGMTYNTANTKKTFTMDVSISPITYNMIICTNNGLNVANFGIDPGKHAVHKFGSSAKCNISWAMSYNISLLSTFFAFTDYSRFYADWENTITFSINRFLTTKLFFDLRYDTDTPVIEGHKWKKLQLKEILSLGFSYTFSTT